jgi:hypothetical protein
MQRLASLFGLELAAWFRAAAARAAPTPRIEAAFAMDATGSMVPALARIQ